MLLKWEKAEGDRMMCASGGYSEWRMVESTSTEDNGSTPVFVLVRIMEDTSGNRAGVQVGEFYEIDAAYAVAQLVEDGKVIEYPIGEVDPSLPKDRM